MAKKFPDMKDEQLDKLLRDAAGRYRPPAAPKGAWEQFEEKMKADALKEALNDKSGIGNRRIIPVWFKSLKHWQIAVACLLVLSLGGAFLWVILKDGKPEKGHPLQEGNTALVPQRENVKRPVRDRGSLTAGRDPVVDDYNNHSHGNLAIDQPIGMDKKMNGDSRITEYMRKALPLIGPIRDPAGLMQSPRKDGAGTILDTDTLGYYAEVIQGQKVSGNSGVAKPNTDTSAVLKPFSKADFLAAGSKSSLSEQRQGHLPVFQPDAELAMNDSRGNEGAGRWAVGLIVGPNLTTVNGSVSKTAGINTGLVVQRRINDSRFSVGSGVVLETMAYNISPGDFRPGGKTIQVATLTGIDGKCQMVDVPVNVRYDVVRSKKNSAFVSTGVSALWMAKESYGYNYSKESQLPRKSMDVSGKGKSLYSVTNLSVGYERSFKKTSVQIEPYIKLPMSSIGYGNLNLGSLGTQISIKHNF